MAKKKVPYRLCSGWSRYIEETEGISISAHVIRRRLNIAGTLGREGIDGGGKYRAADFFSESDVRRVCADLLLRPSTEEAKKNHLDLLSQHGIFDRKSLLLVKPKDFARLDFPPLGKGKALANAILGKSSEQVTIALLEQIADELGFEKISNEDKRKEWIRVLATHGIVDYNTLFEKGPRWFESDAAVFHPYGKGIRFLGKVLERSTRHVTIEVLDELAKELGFVKSEVKDDRRQQLEALASHGINDRCSLFAKKIDWVVARSTAFPPYGGAHAFFGVVLGRRVSRISRALLREVADKLELPEISEESRQKFVQVLAEQGMVDYQSFFSKSANWFITSPDANFPPYGSMTNFGRVILGRRIIKIDRNVLEEIAKKIGFEKPNNIKVRQQQVAALAAHGIVDQPSLLQKGIAWYVARGRKFPPYGGAHAFFSVVLGRKVSMVSRALLREVAEKLWT